MSMEQDPYDFATLDEWRTFLDELIDEGAEDPVAQGDQPEGLFVTAAIEEFEAAGHDKDDLPWPAIVKLAWIFQEREIETLRPGVAS